MTIRLPAQGRLFNGHESGQSDTSGRGPEGGQRRTLNVEHWVTGG